LLPATVANIQDSWQLQPKVVEILVSVIRLMNSVVLLKVLDNGRMNRQRCAPLCRCAVVVQTLGGPGLLYTIAIAPILPDENSGDKRTYYATSNRCHCSE